MTDTYTDECKRIHLLPPNASPYKVLNIKRDSDKSQIKLAYSTLARACHPDKHNPSEQYFFTEVFKKINNANTALTTVNPHEMLQYTSAPPNTPDGDRQNFGPTKRDEEDRKEELKKNLKKWLSDPLLQNPNLTYQDVKTFFDSVNNHFSDYDMEDIEIRGLLVKLEELAITIFLAQAQAQAQAQREPMKQEEQEWILVRLRDYITFNEEHPRHKIRSALFESIINDPRFLKTYDLGLQRLPNTRTYLYDYKYNITQKLWDLMVLWEKYRFAKVSNTLEETKMQQILDEFSPFEDKLDEKTRKKIKGYRTDFTSKKLGILSKLQDDWGASKKLGILSKLQDDWVPISKGGSRRKQSKRRLRKTQQRRKKNNRKSKKRKQV
jgi:hypothetical protein